MQGVPDVLIGHRAALERAEQGAAVDAAGLARVDPAGQGVIAARVEAARGRFAALPVEHAHAVRAQVDVSRPQRDDLADPQARAVQQRDQGAVPDPARGPGRARPDERLYLIGGQDLGRVLPALVRGLPA